MARVTSVSSPGDIAKLNDAISKVDTHEKDIIELKKQLSGVLTQLGTAQAAIANTAQNNLVFVWDGTTGKISWVAGSTIDRAMNPTPVPAGSITSLTANRYYWMIWNPAQKQMAAVNVLSSSVLSNTNNIVLCQVYTGTGAQVGVTIGGGGSSGPAGTGGADLNGSRYKLV